MPAPALRPVVRVTASAKVTVPVIADPTVSRPARTVAENEALAAWVSVRPANGLVLPTASRKLTLPDVPKVREPGPSTVPAAWIFPLVLEMASVVPVPMEVAEPAVPRMMAPVAELIWELAETVRVSSVIPALNSALMLPASVVGPPVRVSPPWKASVSEAASPRVNLPALVRVPAPVSMRLPVKARSKLLPEVFRDPAVSGP